MFGVADFMAVERYATSFNDPLPPPVVHLTEPVYNGGDIAVEEETIDSAGGRL